MTQNKLIAFCYLFIIGIAVAMAFPLAASALAPLWLLTVLLGAASLAALALLRKWRPPVESESVYDAPFRFDGLQTGVWALVLVTGFVFGYTRYLAMIQSPDRLIAHVTVEDGRAMMEEPRDLGETGFLAIRLASRAESEIRLRLVGETDALLPVPDAAGKPTLDADGRWAFTQTTLPQPGNEIVIPEGARPGTVVVVEQPYTRLKGIEVVAAPARARFDIVKPVNTVSLFARHGRNVVPVRVLGRITADPWVYSFKTVLSITPAFIQYQPDGPYLPIDRQTIRVTVEPDLPGYSEIARSAAYGYDVAFGGQLISPSGAATAGSFDQAKYLRNYNIGGQVTLKATQNAFDVIVPRGATAPREGNGLVEFSLYLRDEIVRVIKQTMPQPNSAFLGALTLGLRYGMQNTRSIASGDYDDATVAPILDFGSGSDELIADEFKASGINHVLAVSGLHVTIITIMFMGIFTLLKISKKVYVPFVVFALVVFAIITGARPSTLRAVIMNSLFLLTWGYMGQGVRSSALLGVPVAAFIILIQNPAMAVDPSFTLSFGAILSLALLTQPFFDLFKKSQGNDFIALCILVAVLTWVFAAHWLLATTVRFWILFAVLAAVLFGLSKALTKHGFTPIGNYGFADIPVGISGFIAAQFGMQIGMMIPLSAYYFYRWPVAGAYANLLAIPLVGVVLQLSMLAGLIGLIPGIGIYIALFLNAANWIFSTGFLLIGRYFSSWFVYPFVTKPTLAWLFAYYACCALFVWWRPLWYRHVRPVWRRASASARVFSVAALLAVVLLAACGLRAQKTAMLDEGRLDVAVLSVGYGSGIYVGTPDGKSILIDTAFVQTDRGRRNDAERTIMPFLCSRQIKRLDALILTSGAPEHTAGLPTLLEYLDIDELLYPASAATALERPEIASILTERTAFRHHLSDTEIPRRVLAAGERLFETEYDGKPFAIEVLGPAAGDASAPLTLRLVYGDASLLLCGELTFAQQQALLDRVPADALAADVVIAPAHGTAGLDEVTVGMPNDYDTRLATVTGELLKRSGAGTVIYEFGNPRPVVQDKYKIAVRLHGAAKRAAEEALPEADILATDIAGSITLLTDGTAWTVSTRFLTDSGDTDAPTSLEVGW